MYLLAIFTILTPFLFLTPATGQSGCHNGGSAGDCAPAENQVGFSEAPPPAPTPSTNQQRFPLAAEAGLFQQPDCVVNCLKDILTIHKPRACQQGEAACYCDYRGAADFYAAVGSCANNMCVVGKKGYAKAAGASIWANGYCQMVNSMRAHATLTPVASHAKVSSTPPSSSNKNPSGLDDPGFAPKPTISKSQQLDDPGFAPKPTTSKSQQLDDPGFTPKQTSSKSQQLDDPGFAPKPTSSAKSPSLADPGFIPKPTSSKSPSLADPGFAPTTSGNFLATHTPYR